MISGNNTNEELGGRKADQPGGGGAAAKVAAVASSRHWSASTESRIVRVSRVFGGKDRHSKVRTVKGLRDRRVRLSVPTAIQLYDLQDRLGLSQPSKVVDWLLNAAQAEIDKLPQLQFPAHEHDLVSHLPASSMAPPFTNGGGGDHHATGAASMLDDGDKAAPSNGGGGGGGMKGFMSLSNSLGLLNATMPATLAHHGGAYYATAAAESWGNGGNAHEVSHGVSPHVAAHNSPFPSLLSLAPGSQFIFYSPEGGGGFAAIKEAADQFPVDNLDHSQGQLSLSSARSFLHSGSQG
ncbi:hypothetical protein E2562_015955 [Oryza meyeriana var. granulata]|uniref:TCP domain-containing protein n=1 Tax=Oryza meyeriana var. granulata TaxID=110450 RepID=A0A6G1EKH0_9ORYZ|nr:hypothetical protein E2562_015955 [Oryza meyeriana var. granulata]